MDTSSVFNVAMLDEEHAATFREIFPGKPWIFESDVCQSAFASEEEACEAQHAFREGRGFDPVTGEHLDGTSGQDRESYSDDQDRDSYTVEP